MTRDEYVVIRDKTYNALIAEGYSTTSISLAILGQPNAPDKLKDRKEIVELQAAIRTVPV